MKPDTKTTFQKQSDSDLPLLNWPTVVVRPNTMGGNFVVRRFHVDPALADLVADLAGIGSEVC
jgi:hypothetical protein